MLRNVLALFQTILKNRDVQASEELNDIFEENDLPRIKFHKMKYHFFSKEKDKIIEKQLLHLDTGLNFNPENFELITNLKQISDYVGVSEAMLAVPMNLEEKTNLVNKLNEFMDLNDKILKVNLKGTNSIRSPIDWGFSYEDMQQIPKFTDLFIRMCNDPPELWFPQNN